MRKFRLNLDYNNSNNETEWMAYARTQEFLDLYRYSSFESNYTELVILDHDDYTKRYSYDKIIDYTTNLLTHLMLALKDDLINSYENNITYFIGLREKFPIFYNSQRIIISFNLKELEDLVLTQMNNPLAFKLEYM